MPRKTSSNGDGEPSDQELVDWVLAEKPAAFELFYHRYKGIISHCVRAHADASDADDLIYGFFGRLWTSKFHALRMWQRGTSIVPFLSAVVTNFVFDFYRSNKRRSKSERSLFDIDGIEHIPKERIATEIERAEGNLLAERIEKERRKLVILACSKLEAQDRKLLRYRRRGMDYDAIAVRMPLSLGALRTRMSRALASLVRQLRLLAPEYF